MNILGLLKKKYHKEIEQREEELRNRKQLNVIVDERLIDEVKRLAAWFETPRYVIVEHALDVACFYLTRTLKNPSKREAVRRHLIKDHLLDSGMDDDEVILRIGEGRYASELLSLTKAIARNYRSLQNAMVIAKRTGNTADFRRSDKRLERSVLTLAFWLESHPLDESGNGEAYQNQQEIGTPG